MEILNRVAKIIKDFCGVLTEESIRKNFVLIYEILDETIVIFFYFMKNFMIFWDFLGFWTSTIHFH